MSLEQLGLAGHAAAIALIDGDERITYGELADRVLRTAGAIRARAIPDDARIAVVAGSTIDGIAGYLAVQAAGLLPVILSPRSPLAEMEQRFDAVDPALVLLGSAGVIDLPTGVSLARPAGSTADDAEVLSGQPLAEPIAAGPDDPAVALYTSGVSGLPQLVVLTHGNLEATRTGVIEGPGGGLDAASTVFGGLPPVHVFGLNSIIGAALRAGAQIVLLDEWRPEAAVELTVRHHITSMSLVPLMWKELVGTGDASPFATVSRATYSAAPMPAVVAESVEEMLGVRPAGGFGLTETAGTICQDDPAMPTLKSVGWPLGATEVRVVDDDGDALPGDSGEIWLRGPSVARSYVDGSSVELTDGWYRTGDVGTFDDDHRLFIIDREKDVINVSGFNVSPSEVEWALDDHPAVATSVVVGEIDGDREVVVAHVVLTPGTDVDVDALTEHCRDRLSRYKVPSRIAIRDELPMTPAGKTVRRLLGDA